METVKNVFTFLAGFFQEDKPESFARGITFVVTAFVLGWDTCYLRWTHKLPDASAIGIQIAFMTAFYFGGKGIGAYTAIKTNSQDQPAPESPKGN